ncbi:MAG: hypothetical protein ABSA72_03965 [Nitrososphaerales archaeon]|jgi:hypothetical protein
MKSGDEGRAARAGYATLSESLGLLWACLMIAAFLDLLGVLEGLGFDPALQLEAQPLFVVGILATVVLTFRGAKLGPLLAGVIFWIPIVVLLVELVVGRSVIPFGGDVVGIAEVIVALVGVVAAHNVFHKQRGGWVSGDRGSETVSEPS